MSPRDLMLAVDAQLAHVWMVRAFLKHSDEAQEDDELAEVHRELYDYMLALDYSGRIIGGSWLGDSKENHPDMFWMPTKKIQWTEKFQILNTIYKPSR